jgi:dolichyl-phosphate beta-glucosyltransferase
VVCADQSHSTSSSFAQDHDPPTTILSVVIPALNERDRLPPNLDRIVGYLDSYRYWLPAEIVVVDDGSTDGTGAAVQAVDLPDGIALHLYIHPRNRGKGAATRTGFAGSRGEWVLLTDADLAAPIEGLKILAEAADTGAVAVGSRAVDRRLITNPQPWYRDLMGRTFNLAVRALKLSSFSDTQCGFKLFPGDLARALAAAQRLDGFAFDVEYLALAEAWEISVREVGVEWQHVEASRVLAARHSAQMLRDLLRLWWWRTTGALPPRPASLP